MTIPHNQYSPSTGLQRKAVLLSLIFPRYSHKGTELDHEIIVCPILLLSFRLQKSKPAGFFGDLNKAKDFISI